MIIPSFIGSGSMHLADKRTLKIVWLGLLCSVWLLSACDDANHSTPTPPAAGVSTKPNILLLLADDLGHNDLGINNVDETVQTPNMDRLALAGTRFTRFYTESTCSPSRAALLMGRYAARAGFRPIARGIPPELVTLPEALRKQGYATHHVGKWHLGSTVKEAWPLAQGFDTSFGFLNQWSLHDPSAKAPYSYPSYFDPWLKINNHPRQRFEGHLTDLLADRTVELIEQGEATEPWFIYHAFFAPHTPIEPAARFMSEFPDTPAGKFKALLSQLDSNVGRILESLRRTGQFDNTIVILASDNGGINQAFDNNFPYYGKKGTYWEGGVRVPLVIHWPQQFGAGSVNDTKVGIFDIYPTLMNLISPNNTNEALDGISFANSEHNDVFQQRDLFWESFIWHLHVYGTLSADDVRLFHEFNGNDHLLDLAIDPTGNTELLEDRDARIEELRVKYENWRSEIRKVDTTFSRQGPNGRGMLTGDNFQRSPGLAGYTFAIGITPSSQPHPGASVQIVAQQPGLLNIAMDRTRRLTVEIDGQTLRSGEIAPDRCHSIVVTAFFSRHLSAIASRRPRIPIVRLLVNGSQVDLKHSTQTVPTDHRLDTPTYIGQSAREDRFFHGKLSLPEIYNQELVGQALGFPEAEELHSVVCPTS